ncbi:mannitol dehydrogenase family protein [Anaerolentibacter hominis]|uniref:mannitol dehydrogenase family protein n=1 Tax=Anaerolentibacter hominis TaxID=3079009 RepID=UPI0031B8297D
MKLTQEALNQKEWWEEHGYSLPKFDRQAMISRTVKDPEWVHFGTGNIFKAFIANMWQGVLNEGKADKGIIAAEGFDYEIVEKVSIPHDNLALAVTLKADGSIDKTVVGSIAESIEMDTDQEAAWERLKEIFRNPSLKMASFTITEKGYNLTDVKGNYLPVVEADFYNGPGAPSSYIGKVTALCYERYKAGRYPIAMVSMDNCSHNGTKLFEAVSAYAANWVNNGFAEKEFAEYIVNPRTVGFPWSMIDKITPRPDDSVKEMLNKDGFEDTEAIITSKKTFVAPFVNAEEPQYLVIEDIFPNGRPAMEAGGVIFTDRETVDKVEKMKVCTCLNPLHTSLAVFGCLLGHTLISAEMKDAQLKKMVEIIGYKEGLPVVVDPGIISPKAFIDEVINTRFPNPFMPDTPQRIATDTSQKLAIRFGETIKAYAASPDLNVNDLKLIPLVLAGWCRYLMGINDEGNTFEISPDPLLDSVCPYVADIRLGDAGPFHGKLQPILSNEKIFGLNLYDAGIGEKVENYFAELVAGPGAVRGTLKKYTA